MPLTRRKEREVAFQMLFASLFDEGTETEALLATYLEEWDDEAVRESEYVKKTFCGARRFFPRADEIIEQNAGGRKIERLSKTTLAILRLALYEMLESDEVPLRIAINEAVELAKQFDEEGGAKFINGILGSVAGK